MKPLLPGLLAALTLTFTLPSIAQAGEFISGVRTTDMLELYTSESCSSCPPADRWFTTLKADDGVFEQFIPMAFHVDYWNYLGWADRFASPVYSGRQRKHVAAGNVRQSYTPQVVLNSKEWRGHLRGVREWEAGNKPVLAHSQQTVDAKPQKWQMDAPIMPKVGQKQTALVVWLSDPVTQKLVQAVGGYL